MLEIVIPLALVAFLGSLGMGLVLWSQRGRLNRIQRPREDDAAIQASHVGDTLRLGGVGVFAGLLLGTLFLKGFSSGEFTLLLLLATVPVFLAGLAEDLGYRVSPMGRFVAALVSAGIAVKLLGLWIHDPEILGLQWVFAYAPIAITATILFAAFFCHSVNLIDGMNGLSSAVVISSALGISYIAGDVGQNQISAIGFLLAAAMLGFAALNWPKGLILLGDAGAYGLGHLLVWLAIALGEMSNIPNPTLLLLLFWPLADTVHTILRRLLAGKSVTQPDRMHLHQKIRRGLEITMFGPESRHVSNPVTTLVMAPLIAMPVVAGVVWRDNVAMSWGALVAFSVLFAVAHLVVTEMVRLRRRRMGDRFDDE